MVVRDPNKSVTKLDPKIRSEKIRYGKWHDFFSDKKKSMKWHDFCSRSKYKEKVNHGLLKWKDFCSDKKKSMKEKMTNFICDKEEKKMGL